MHHKALIIICTVATVYSLACYQILEMPSNQKPTLEQLKSTTTQDMIECLAHLGKEQLPIDVATFIWHSIVTEFNGIPNIPDHVLIQLHWVTPAIPPEDYSNLTLSSIDVIENFGLNYNLNNEQLNAIADRVRSDFAGKEPEDFTYYDLTALRQILCAFNRSEVERIRPSAYREAAIIIGKLERCSSEVMLGFATLAVQKSAFGAPDKWAEIVFKIVGAVADYLPKNSRQSYNTET